MTRTLSAIAPWFGSKRTLAPEIVRELGPHRAYWEPFCGSCAVLLAKPPCNMETVCDLHGDLTNLAIVLASERWVDLADRTERTLLSEALFRQCLSATGDARPADIACAIHDVADRHVEWAWAYLVASWAGRNGMAGTPRADENISVRYTTGGGSSPARFRNVGRSIPAWHERLKNVLILCRDAFEVLPRIEDAEGACLYIDPPYFAESRGTGRKAGPTGGSRYLFDFEADEHERLAEALGRFQRARVVVSYYEHPRLAALYPTGRWTHRAVHRQKNLHVQNRRGEGACTAPEVLLVNGPSFAAADRDP